MGHSPVGYSPVGHLLMGHSPVDHSPVGHSPASYSPVGHSPVGHSPVSYSPVGHSPVVHSRIGPHSLVSILWSYINSYQSSRDPIMPPTLPAWDPPHPPLFDSYILAARMCLPVRPLAGTHVCMTDLTNYTDCGGPLTTDHWPLTTDHWPLTTDHWPLTTGVRAELWPATHTVASRGGP